MHKPKQLECIVFECNKPRKTGNRYCSMHRGRLTRTGRIDKKSDIERFEDNVLRIPEAGCWLWLGKTDIGGYGNFWIAKANGGKPCQAHRYSYELHKTEIPEGLVIDHLCRVRSCVNPEHLEPVTQKENIRRGNTSKHQRDKTHCPKGHPYSGDNLYINKNGSRICRTCANENAKLRRRRIADKLDELKIHD